MVYNCGSHPLLRIPQELYMSSYGIGYNLVYSQTEIMISSSSSSSSSSSLFSIIVGYVSRPALASCL